MQTEVYSVELDDGTVVWLPAESWYQVVRTGLRECGYLKNRELRCMSMSAGSPSGSRGRESRNGCEEGTLSSFCGKGRCKCGEGKKSGT